MSMTTTRRCEATKISSHYLCTCLCNKPYSELSLIFFFGSEIAEDGKSFINPPAKSQSGSYNQFVDPITKSERGGFDVHIYFWQANEYETKFAKELHERVRRECN